jgi:lactoylglutathione lyase
MGMPFKSVVMEMRLIVIRTGNMQAQVEFYNLLGVHFEYHSHGNGPFHYSAQIGPTVFEMYPLAKNQVEADKNIRLGIGIDNFDHVITALRNAGVAFNDPVQTAFGFMTVITDPDGRRVELYKK